jgi:hypothetical protein
MGCQVPAPNINFFQAAAEVIPTLLIALVFAARFLTTHEKGFFTVKPSDAVWGMLAFLIFLSSGWRSR